MSKTILYCDALPGIPWQDKPDGAELPLWRYTENPVIRRNPLPGVARIFNSAVVPFEGGYIGVFRGEQTNGIPFIYLGRSADGIHWDFDRDKIPFVNEQGEPFMPPYAYDPRLVKVEDTYYIIWCQDFYGASIGIAKTRDFQTFTRVENPFVPFNRNAVLFPRKINGMFTLLSRPSDSGHTPFGDIFLSQSPDMEFWGRHRHVMGKSGNWWENLKIGGGAAPIETSEGWLLFYHGVTGTCNGYVYSIGGAILDRDEPSRVLHQRLLPLRHPAGCRHRAHRPLLRLRRQLCRFGFHDGRRSGRLYQSPRSDQRRRPRTGPALNPTPRRPLQPLLGQAPV